MSEGKQNDRQTDKQPSLGVRVKQNDRQMDKQPSLGVRVNRMTDRRTNSPLWE